MEETYKSNKILILSSTNYEKWFALNKAKLQAKGGTYILEMKRIDYTRLHIDGGAEYDKLDGLAKELIIQGTNDIDLTRIIDKPTAKDQWDVLIAKYKDTRKEVVASKQKEFVNYEKKPEQSIQDAWAILYKIRNDIVAIKPSLKTAYDTDEVLYRLYNSLPPEYSTTVATLKANEEKDDVRALRVLQEMEDSLRATKTGIYARHPRQGPSATPFRSRTNRSPPSEQLRNPRTKSSTRRCYICDDEGHKVQECEAFEAIKKMIRALKEKKKKPISKIEGKRPQKAYEADSDTSDTAEEDEEEEIAHLTKEAASKLHPNSWLANTGASSHMTDKINLFSGPLARIRRRTIKVRGGVLYADQMGKVVISSRKGKPVEIMRVYYVPGLGANLLSCRRLCILGLTGRFNTNSIVLHTKEKKDMLKANHEEGVYVLTWISSKFPTGVTPQGSKALPPKGLKAFQSLEEIQSESIEVEHPQTKSIEQTDQQETVEQPVEQVERETVEKPQLAREYFLIHRRFAHFNSNIIAKLYKVTTYRPVQRPKYKSLYATCTIGKTKKKINRIVALRKDNLLDLISINICGLLLKSLVGNTTFLEIVDNYSRKVWTICTKDRKSIPSELDTWKTTVELQTGQKLKAVRLDNAMELLSVVKEWVKKYGLTLQDTEPYTSHQNGVAERAIQTTEASVRAMIHDAQLPIEFWDEAAKTSAYLKNHTPAGPIIDDKPTSPEQIYTGKLPTIDHIRVWGCKCIAYVNPDSHPTGTRRDKLMPKGREAVLMGFDPETTRQYRIYAPDLGRCIKASTVTFFEDIKGGEIDLKLTKCTPNVLVTRNPTKRVADPANPPTAANQPVPADPPTTEALDESPPISALKPPPFMPLPQLPTVSASPQLNTTASSIPWLPALKRKRDEEIDDDEKVTKHIKALLAMKAIETAAIMGPIQLPNSYEEAITDPVYGPYWFQATKDEVSQLEANNTWITEIPPEGANIVTCKWVFAVKYNQDGTVQKFKARLIVRGFSQIHGIDYDETFAPTVRIDTLRALIALIAI